MVGYVAVDLYWGRYGRNGSIYLCWGRCVGYVALDLYWGRCGRNRAIDLYWGRNGRVWL